MTKRPSVDQGIEEAFTSLDDKGAASSTAAKKPKIDDDSRKIAAPSRKPREDIVSATNKLSSEEIIARYVDDKLLHLQRPVAVGAILAQEFSITFKFARDVPPDQMAACFSLLETTSKSDYASSNIGWHPKQKKKEMCQEEMRYLLVWARQSRKPDNEGGMTPVKFQGFLSFMITHEAGQAVLYIYEIHLVKEAEGRGLGRHLMHIAETIATSIGPKIEKVMLTCFVVNLRAATFYRRLGYSIDESSPQARRIRGKLIESDYIIMSKRLSDKQPGK